MKRKRAFVNPAQAISHCPSCKCRDLIRLEIDVLCARCDWTSLEAYVEAGGMDNIVAAYNAHFPRRTSEIGIPEIEPRLEPTTLVLSAS